MSGLRLGQAGALADWQLFVSRLQRMSEDAAVRLTVHMDVLVLTGAPLYPATLGDEMPLVLAMRMLPLADSSSDGLDKVVAASALGDRFARAQSTGATEIGMPPAEVPVPWTAHTPPRGGWRRVGTIATETLTAASESGIAEVAAGTPEHAGTHAVARLRRLVWSRQLDDHPEIPAGAAFVMDRMGFLHRSSVNPDEAPVRVYACDDWLRLSSPVGHVVVRNPAVRNPRTN